MKSPQRIFLDLLARDTVVSLGKETKLMGILNCTPDSFSGDGKLKKHPQGKIDTGLCLRFARQMVRDGADILDVGGESTRPNAASIPVKEEIRRVLPVLGRLARSLKVPLSVDTTKYEVACRALDAGASIINNVRGTKASTVFLRMVRSYNAAIVLMHSRGTPATMHSKSNYVDVVDDVINELKISVEKCLAIGIKKERIIIDPGLGFAKTVDQNLTLINYLYRFNVFKCPILIGTSRKSFIGKVLDDADTDRLLGTAATVTAGVLRGAHIVRVHDVKAIKQTLKVTDAILSAH